MPDEKSPSSSKKIMSWVGGATAILTLLFGLQQLVGWVSNARTQRQRTSELMAVAKDQQHSGHYPEAWASLEEAAQLDSDNDDIAVAREDLAMTWLREARVRVGEQTFSDLVAPLLPVLERGALKAEGSRKADLLAHAGWADFLRSRDGQRGIAADAQYKRAIDVDAENPYAHAMLGHWILSTGGDVASAQQHFRTAITANRERAYVRSMQVAGIMNRSGEDNDEEMLALANEMRQQRDSMDAGSRRRFFWETCTTGVQHAPGWIRSAARISPTDEITTLRWLIGNNAETHHKDLLVFCEARAHAWAGDTTRALGLLRALATNASGDAVRWDAKQTVDRLAR
jgi:tetratricopeptide (TPR) repeat protein